MNGKKRIHVLVSGIVQGVFFRSEAQRKAFELKLTGWVRNIKNGKVEMVFEGDKNKTKQMIKWIKKGPKLAKVTKINIKKERYKNEFKDFKIKY
jgi:acylphosphatase